MCFYFEEGQQTEKIERSKSMKKTPRTLYWFPHFKQELHEHFSNQREFKKGIVRTLQFMNIRTNSHTHHIQHTDTPEKKLWYQMRQLSLSEVCLHEELSV